MDTKKNWQDWANLLLGLWIFILPWAVRHPMADGAAAGSLMWNFWVAGLAVAVLALTALVAYQAWAEWVNLILGAWLLISPWALGFSSATLVTWNAVIFGVLIAAFAGWKLIPESSEKKESST